MIHLKFIICLVLLPLIVFAQSTGHPGGGGPDGGTTENTLVCKGIKGTLEELEQKFCTSWKKPYRTQHDFFALMDEILMAKSLHSLKYFKSDALEYKYICQKVKELNLENILNDRSPEELVTLKKLQREWNKAFENNLRCGNIFTPRKEQVEELRLLIKMYEQAQD
jgi:hypothetical protein